MTKPDLCSVRAVGGGLGAEEVWQCTGQRSCMEPTAQGGATTAQGEMVCSKCGRTFRRQGDLKCLLERSKPVEQQKGSVQCTQCHRWLVVLVCTRKLVEAAAETRSFLGRTRDPYWAVFRQDNV